MNALKSEFYQCLASYAPLQDFVQSSSIDGLAFGHLHHEEKHWFGDNFWEMLGHSPAAVPPAAAQSAQAAWAQLLAQARKHFAASPLPFEHLVAMRQQNGTVLMLHCTAMRVPGPPEAVACKLRQAQPEAQKHKLEAIVKALPDLLMVIDRQGVYKEFYAQNVDHLALPPETIIGSNMSQIFEPAQTKEVLQLFEKTLETGEVVAYNYYLWSKGQKEYYEARFTDLGNHNDVLVIARNVSKEKAAERELIESRTMLTDLANTLPGLILRYRLWPDGRDEVLFVSKGVEQLYEITVEEATAKVAKLWAAIHPDDLPDTAESVRQSADKLSYWQHEWRIRTGSGATKWVIGRGMPQRQSDGGTLWNTIILDITERKKAEAERDTLAKEYEQVFNGTQDAMFLVEVQNNGQHFVYKRNNRTHQQLTGFSLEHIRSKTPQQLVGEEVGNLVAANYARCLQAGRSIQYNEELDLPGGKRYWLTTLTPVFMEQGNTYIVGSSIEITEQKRAEAMLQAREREFRALVENSPDIIARFDHEFRHVYVNPAILAATGLTNADFIGKTHQDLGMELDVVNFWRSKYNAAWQTGQEQVYEFDFPTPQGNRIFHCRLVPETDEQGRVVSLLSLARDITDLKQVQTELAQAKERAEAASKAKSEFLANMSHEIRTPLNGVIGFAELLGKTQLNSTQQQYANLIGQSAHSLLDIINDILDFSKIEAGKLELSIEQTDLLELCSQAMDMFKFQAHQKGLELLLKLPYQAPNLVWADSVRLRQVLANLLSNAVKFTQHGEVALEVSVVQSLGPRSTFRFAVRDTGIGIAPTNQRKIFEAFAQEDASTTRKFGGTGLGLSISNKLLALMSSALHLQSTPGQGTTFYFDLELRAEQGSATQQMPPAAIGRVLVVDDNPANRQILNDMLAFWGIECHLAANGIDALEKLKANTYDVAIIDYQMPYLNGIDTIGHIRRQLQLGPQALPIVLLYSSPDDSQISAACQLYQVAHCLIKPVPFQVLHGTLAKLGGKAAQATPAPQNERPLPLAPLAAQVLVAEDNPTNMLLAKAIMSMVAPQLQVLEATNGRQAIDMCEQYRPQLVLMDVQMPEVNGYEATQAIRRTAHGAQVPIIALTAGTVLGERERCIEAGMNDFLSKPIVAEQIAQCLEKWLGNGTKPLPTLDKRADYKTLDENFWQELLTISKQKIEELMQHIGQAVAQQQWGQGRPIAHDLRGTALTIGAAQLAALGSQLEQAPPTELLKPLLQQALAEAKRVLQAIERQLPPPML